MTPWDFIKNLTVNKTKWDSYTENEKNDFNSYMAHKVLSMDEKYIELTNIVQKLPPAEKKQIYNVYFYDKEDDAKNFSKRSAGGGIYKVFLKSNYLFL